MHGLHAPCHAINKLWSKAQNWNPFSRGGAKLYFGFQMDKSTY